MKELTVHTDSRSRVKSTEITILLFKCKPIKNLSLFYDLLAEVVKMK